MPPETSLGTPFFRSSETHRKSMPKKLKKGDFWDPQRHLLEVLFDVFFDVFLVLFLGRFGRHFGFILGSLGEPWGAKWRGKFRLFGVLFEGVQKGCHFGRFWEHFGRF